MQIGELLRAKGKQFGIDSSGYLNKVSTEIEKLTMNFEPLVKEIDPTLEEPLKKTTATAINAYSQFLGRLSKASLQKDSVILNRIEKVKSQLFPSGKEQERVLGLVSILARTGRELIPRIEEQSGTLDGKIQTLVIEEL